MDRLWWAGISGGGEMAFRWCTAFLFCVSLASAQQWRPLMDGKTTKGWKLIGDGVLKVQDGAFVATHTAASDIWGHVVSDSVYEGDFTIRFNWKLVRGNSGFAFNSYVGSVSGMYGPQAELHTGSPGGLLMTYPDGSPQPWAWIDQPSAAEVKAWYKPGDWNLTTIVMKGKRVTVTLNGNVSADITDAQFPLKGHFGIQLHKLDDTEIQVKGIELFDATATGLSVRQPRFRLPAGMQPRTLDGRRAYRGPLALQSLF